MPEKGYTSYCYFQSSILVRYFADLYVRFRAKLIVPGVSRSASGLDTLNMAGDNFVMSVYSTSRMPLILMFGAFFHTAPTLLP